MSNVDICGSGKHEHVLDDVWFDDECRAWVCEACYEETVDAMRDCFDPMDDICDFADPGGRSALRAATEDNPRNLPCPTCGAPNRLTPADRALGYQCDSCADMAEMGGW